MIENKYFIILMIVTITLSSAVHLLIILILKYLLYVDIIILSSVSRSIVLIYCIVTVFIHFGLKLPSSYLLITMCVEYAL